MLEAMQEHEASKTKSGRLSALSLEAQILLAMTYWYEYRTLYHIGMHFNVHDSSASRIVRKAEDTLVNSGRFDLPWELPHSKPEDINWSAVIIDATEAPIERPKKTKVSTTAEKRNNIP